MKFDIKNIKFLLRLYLKITAKLEEFVTFNVIVKIMKKLKKKPPTSTKYVNKTDNTPKLEIITVNNDILRFFFTDGT